jgi:dihydrofolate reductase
MISIVVATDKNGVIGRENKIPWRISKDRVILKKLTKDNTVILGRVTYESMVWYYDRSGRPMPGKTYIVVTRSEDYKPAREDARVAHSIAQAIELANSLGDKEILAIGGSGIFNEILPFTDRIYLSEIQAEVEGDSYFPKLDKKDWNETSRTHYEKDEKNEYDFDLIVLERS